MANVWKDGRQVAGNRIDSISPDKTFSQRFKELVAQLPPEAKSKVQLFNDLADEVEKMELSFGKTLRHAEKLEKQISDLESGDQNMITGLQKKMDEQRAEQKIVLKTLMKAFAGHHGIGVEASDIEDFLRLF